MTNKYVVEADLNFDSSYAAGGEALNPGDFGLNVIEEIFFEQVRSKASSADVPISGAVIVYDRKNKKIRAFQRGKVITGEALTVTGSATTWISSATKYKPAAFLAVFNSTTQLTVMASASTQVTGKVKPNYGAGVLVSYDDTHTAGLTVDYLTDDEFATADDLSDYIVRAMVVGY
jgi:hypothetical protein